VATLVTFLEMTTLTEAPQISDALEAARAVSAAAGLPYAGNVPPRLAWDLFSAGHAQLVDVRSAEERKFVGHVPESLHVAWATRHA